MFWPETQPDLKPLKHAAMLNPESLPETTPADFQFDYIDIGSVTYSKGITEKQAMVFSDAPSRARKPVKENDLIISTVRTYLRAIAKIGASDTGSVASTGFAVCRPRDGTQPNYLYYAVHSQPFIEQIVALSTGMSYPAINPSTLGDIRLPLPSPSKQTAIANFLDRETTQIDGLIEKKGRFIALLKEKRAAVITHAVTKGVDPAVTMKEGSFKALGQVPAHWDLSPVGRALKVCKRTVGSRHSDFTLLSLTKRGIIVRDISENAGKFPESFDTYQEVRPKDFVFCLFDIDETPRTVGRSEVSGMITGAYSVFECIDSAYSSFLLYLFLHLDACKGLKPFYTGLRKTIRPPRFASIRVPFAPPDEAARIVEHIEWQTSRIDGLISKTERSIDLLKEKRSALITAAVTGKIDVRNAA